MKTIIGILFALASAIIIMPCAKSEKNAPPVLIGIGFGYGGGMTKGWRYSLYPKNAEFQTKNKNTTLEMEADNDYLSHHFSEYEMPADTLIKMQETVSELRLEELPEYKRKKTIPGIEMLDGSNEYYLTLYYNDGSAVKKSALDKAAKPLEKFFHNLCEKEKARKDNVIIKSFALGENVDYKNPKAHIGAKEYRLKEKSKGVYEVYASTFKEDEKYGDHENYGENLSEKNLTEILSVIKKSDFEKSLAPMNKSKYKVSMQRNIGRAIYQGIDEKTAEKLIKAFEKLKKAE